MPEHIMLRIQVREVQGKMLRELILCLKLGAREEEAEGENKKSDTFTSYHSSENKRKQSHKLKLLPIVLIIMVTPCPPEQKYSPSWISGLHKIKQRKEITLYIKVINLRPKHTGHGNNINWLNELHSHVKEKNNF